MLIPLSLNNFFYVLSHSQLFQRLLLQLPDLLFCISRMFCNLWHCQTSQIKQFRIFHTSNDSKHTILPTLVPEITIFFVYNIHFYDIIQALQAQYIFLLHRTGMVQLTIFYTISDVSRSISFLCISDGIGSTHIFFHRLAVSIGYSFFTVMRCVYRSPLFTVWDYLIVLLFQQIKYYTLILFTLLL